MPGAVLLALFETVLAADTFLKHFLLLCVPTMMALRAAAALPCRLLAPRRYSSVHAAGALGQLLLRTTPETRALRRLVSPHRAVLLRVCWQRAGAG